MIGWFIGFSIVISVATCAVVGALNYISGQLAGIAAKLQQIGEVEAMDRLTR